MTIHYHCTVKKNLPENIDYTLVLCLSFSMNPSIRLPPLLFPGALGTSKLLSSVASPLASSYLFHQEAFTRAGHLSLLETLSSLGFQTCHPLGFSPHYWLSPLACPLIFSMSEHSRAGSSAPLIQVHTHPQPEQCLVHRRVLASIVVVGVLVDPPRSSALPAPTLIAPTPTSPLSTKLLQRPLHLPLCLGV